MKKIILIFLVALTSLSIYAQDISGKWSGILKVQGIQLRIVFNITKTENGYSSTMDSPDQGAKGIPVTSIIFKDSLLKIELSNFGITYEGTLNKESAFAGTFIQYGQSFPLVLIKGEVEKEKVIRPQEPVKPYPYYSEDVKFENAKDKIVLAGTLTLPRKEGLFPAVVLISGSGPENRDEEVFGHKPFLVLADYLTKSGIAVLRFDDRGTGESTGDFKSATTFDFATDVESAVKYLKTRDEIDKKHIGLIGHSEGGIIAPIVASGSKEISFIVLLAAPGIRGDKLLLMQQELIGKASGMSDKEIKQTIAINKTAFDIILKSNNNDSLKKELTDFLKQTIKENPSYNVPPGMSEDDYVKLQVGNLASPWMTTFIKYDPSLALEKVKCPVLALNGEKDLQVPAKVNLSAIKKALEKSGNKDVTVKEFPGLNHLFQECKTGLPSEYATIEQTISPAVLKEIRNWILERVK